MGYRFYGKFSCKRLMWGKTPYENCYGQGFNRKLVKSGVFKKKDICVISTG